MGQKTLCVVYRHKLENLHHCEFILELFSNKKKRGRCSAIVVEKACNESTCDEVAGPKLIPSQKFRPSVQNENIVDRGAAAQRRRCSACHHYVVVSCQRHPSFELYEHNHCRAADGYSRERTAHVLTPQS